MENREAAANREGRVADRQTATARLLPTFTATGSYTRNEYQVQFPMGGTLFTVQPHNQWDAALALTVPIIDVGAWERRAVAGAVEKVAATNERLTSLDVERRVARTYYQLVGAEALLDATRRGLEVSQKNADLVRERLRGGTVSELDVQRALADVARTEQNVADAENLVVATRRDLATLSGLEPEPVTSVPEDDLHVEAPLASWQGVPTGSLPAVAMAAAQVDAAQKSVRAARAAWFPTLSAGAQERFTNSTAFNGGHEAHYVLQATLNWRLDPANVFAERAQRASLTAARAREARSEREAQDAIVKAWNQVRASIQKAKSARAQSSAARLAAELARDRYIAGATTQQVVLQVQQDALAAEAARIGADADLGFARALLRTVSGRSLTEESR